MSVKIERNRPLLLILKMPKITINGLTMPNFMPLVNCVAQSQNQRSLLNSSRNSEKNEYKLDYVLNKCSKSLFCMHNETMGLIHENLG
jgi:hypothetical protein